MESDTDSYGIDFDTSHVFMNRKIPIMVVAVGLDWRLRDLDLLKVTQGQIKRKIELHHKICCESSDRLIIVFCILIS